MSTGDETELLRAHLHALLTAVGDLQLQIDDLVTWRRLHPATSADFDRADLILRKLEERRAALQAAAADAQALIRRSRLVDTVGPDTAVPPDPTADADS